MRRFYQRVGVVAEGRSRAGIVVQEGLIGDGEWKCGENEKCRSEDEKPKKGRWRSREGGRGGGHGAAAIDYSFSVFIFQLYLIGQMPCERERERAPASRHRLRGWYSTRELTDGTEWSGKCRVYRKLAQELTGGTDTEWSGSLHSVTFKKKIIK